ncbi:dihydropteroate synthase [Pseudochelatococcus sp. G4_1912]|uniref:dihydropteroate synthase n=1 Tax=Pseudochelatococcus sp. G4_1912 TaxID=3114288 RepID=UPI0039C67A4F
MTIRHPLFSRLCQDTPLIMGILNVTPDSFSDGGMFGAVEAAHAHAMIMLAEGADIIDVGGESTRPGHEEVSAEDEQARVLPVLAAISPIAHAQNVPISIDTYKAATAEAALKAGATVINDVWGLQREPDIAHVAAAHGAPVIVMHNRTEIDPSLQVIDELCQFFDRSIAIAHQAGIDDGSIILDPGIGFGKTPAQSMEALSRLSELRARGYPILVGASRKSFIGALINQPPQERLYGTLSAHMFAVAQGADILRVHDVRPHVEAKRVWKALVAAGE